MKKIDKSFFEKELTKEAYAKITGGMIAAADGKTCTRHEEHWHYDD
jgi:hypothetical protein